MCGEVEVKQKGIRPTPLPVLATLFMVRTDANFYGKRPCLGENFASLGGFGMRGHVILPDQGYSNRADGTIHGSALLYPCGANPFNIRAKLFQVRMDGPDVGGYVSVFFVDPANQCGIFSHDRSSCCR